MTRGFLGKRRPQRDVRLPPGRTCTNCRSRSKLLLAADVPAGKIRVERFGPTG